MRDHPSSKLTSQPHPLKLRLLFFLAFLSPLLNSRLKSTPEIPMSRAGTRNLLGFISSPAESRINPKFPLRHGFG